LVSVHASGPDRYPPLQVTAMSSSQTLPSGETPLSTLSKWVAPHALCSLEKRTAPPPTYFLSDVVLAPPFVASEMTRTPLTRRDAGAMLGGAVGATGAYYVGQPLAGHAITAAITGAGAGSIYMPITVSATSKSSSSPSWSHPTHRQKQTLAHTH
jgi:hypothetical protein